MADKRERIPLEMEKPAHQAPDAAPSPETSSLPPIDGPIDTQDVEEKIVAALKTCYDPEIPVNIYELGLIYEVNISPENVVKIKMTLTSPACPVAGTLPGDVQAKVKAVSGVADAQVEVVWDPIWTPERM